MCGRRWQTPIPILYGLLKTPRSRHLATKMAIFKLFNLSLLLTSLFSSAKFGLRPESEKEWVGIFPPTCSRIECPSYDVIFAGDDYEIRRYNSTVWMSTAPIQDISFVGATRNGFMQLFDYIQGKNNAKEQIEMTAPVLTQVLPSDGPFCQSSFVVSFYVPKVNQANPPLAEGLHVQKWGSVYAAVRQFSGFIRDTNVGEEAAALHASLEGTIWSAAIDKSHATDPTTVYTVAQYNSPFEFDNRVNEIWLMFDM